MDMLRDRLRAVAAVGNVTERTRLETLADFLEVVEYRRFLDLLYLETLRILSSTATSEEALAMFRAPEFVDLVQDTNTLRLAAIARGTQA